MVADATQLNKIELLLKTVPSMTLLEHKDRDSTQATQSSKTIHAAHHRFYTCSFSNGGHPKG